MASHLKHPHNAMRTNPIVTAEDCMQARSLEVSKASKK